jgi:hypothetical protein
MLTKRTDETVHATSITNFLNNAGSVQESPIQGQSHWLGHTRNELLNLIAETNAADGVNRARFAIIERGEYADLFLRRAARSKGLGKHAILLRDRDARIW